MSVDISKLPPPPTQVEGPPRRQAGEVDISSLPLPPPSISNLPPPPPEAMDPDYAAVRGTINRSFWAAPLIDTEEVSRKESDAIARAKGIDPNVLWDLSVEAGALRAGDRDVAGEVLSSAGRGVGLNIPQFIAKKSIDDPKLREAFDEMQDLADAKRSFARGIAENIIPTGAAAKLLTRGGKEAAEQVAKRTLTKQAVEGAGIGAVAGVGRSKEGQELEAAGVGAGAGALLGFGIGKLTKPAGVSREADEIITETNKQLADIDTAVNKQLSDTADTEQLIEQAILSGRKLNKEEAIQVVEQVEGKDAVRKLLEPSTEALSKYKEQAGSGDLLLVGRANDIIKSRAKRLAEEVAGAAVPSKSVSETLQKYVASNEGGIDQLREVYGRVRYKELANRYITDRGIRLAGQEDTLAGRISRAIQDNQFVLDRIDDRMGTTTGRALSLASNSFNKSTNARTAARIAEQELFNKAKRLGIARNETKLEEIYDAVQDAAMGNTSKLEQLDTKQLQLWSAFSDHFKKQLDYFNTQVAREGGEGVTNFSIKPVGNKEFYLPKYMVTIPETLARVAGKEQQVIYQARTQLGKQVTNISELSADDLARLPAAKELQQASKFLLDTEATSPQELSKAIQEMKSTSRSNRQRLGTRAQSLLERHDIDVPKFLQERNLFKLADRYNSNMTRHAFMRNHIANLHKQADVLDSLGANADAAYVRRIANDYVGNPAGSLSDAMAKGSTQLEIQMLAAIEKAGGPDTLRGKSLQVVHGLAEAMLFSQRNIYPNVLGWSPRAAIQNLTSTVTKLYPELGLTPYGSATMLRAAMYTSMNRKALLNRARTELGTIPAEFIRQGQEYLLEGINASSPIRLTTKAIDAINKVGMSAFQKSEEMNRILTLGAADIMASDLTKGSTAAIRALNKFPLSIRKQVAAAGNNTKAISDILARHLNDKTAYNYNRLSMSEFGRWVGPFFSIFTKWPTATAGDIMYTLQRGNGLKDAARVGEKYIAPLILLQLADVLLSGEGLDFSTDETSDRSRRLLGRYGLSQSAPIGSLAAIGSGEIFSPPIADIVTQGIVAPIVEGSDDKALRAFSNAIGQFVPGMGLVRGITDDLVTIVTGERPEGKHFLERTASGIEEITRK